MNMEVSGIHHGQLAPLSDMTPPPDMIGHSDRKHALQNPFMEMIVCSACEHMVYSPVESNECNRLARGGLIFRHCYQCGETTGWVQFESHHLDRDQPLLYQTTQPDRV